MLIAIALFGNEISPRFDCCTEIAFVQEGSDFCKAKRIRMEGKDSELRLFQVLNCPCRILLCGGILQRDRLRLEAAGIQVIDGLNGSAGERVCEYRNCPCPIKRLIINNGKEENMPGCNGKGPAGSGPGTGRRKGRCGLGGTQGSDAETGTQTPKPDSSDKGSATDKDSSPQGYGNRRGHGQGRRKG